MLKKSNTTVPPIIMRPINEIYLASEAPKGSNLEVRDSGRGSPLTDDELKASIYSHGIIQPLILKGLGGKWYAIAGNRRLRFLREIFADALVSQVQTQNVDDFEGDWREIAISTNVALPPHLVERYEVIVALSKDLKLSPQETCTRYGMSDQQYRRVMALGKMAPAVRQAWKEGLIDAKTAQAFTLESDPVEQEKIYASLSKGARRVSDYEVKRRIVPQAQHNIGQFVAFVGLETVRKAKLLKQEDLFASEHSADHIVTDPKALNKLVGDKLDAKCKELVAAGWKWALPHTRVEGNLYSYGTIEPKKTAPLAEEKKRLEAIKQLLNSDGEYDPAEAEAAEYEQERIEQAIALRGFTPEQMAKGGCVLKIARDGSLNIEYGRVKPSEKKQVAASERPKKAPSKPKKPGQVGLTNALAERLSLSLQKGISESFLAKPHVAVAALIAGFASSGHVIDVDIRSRDRKYSSPETNAKNFLQVFEGALAASPESRVVMLAKIVAEALSIQVHSGEAKPPMADSALTAMVAAMSGIHVDSAVKSFFDAADYFGAVDLRSIVEAVRCTMGEEHAGKVAKMKKKDAAKFAATHLPVKGYLPPMLRTPHYKGPTETAAKAAPASAAKKDKKPKPAKKAAKKKPRK